MRQVMTVLVAASAVLTLVARPAAAEERGHWRGGEIHRFHERDFDHWQHGQWWHGWHEGRAGWWWIVGGIWYFYPAPVYPYPDPYRPPLVAAPPGGQFWYYCANPAGYYPYVPACSMPWQAVPATPQPPQPPAYAPPAYAPPGPPPPSGQAEPGEFGANKATAGTVLGAVGGGVAGAQFGHGSGKLAATAVGTLLGAFVGHEVGTSLDRADQLAAERAEHAAYDAPMGQAITWNNPDSGHSGTITPVRDGRDGAGNYCREFQQNVVVDGKAEQEGGTACRKPDGSWQIMAR